MLYFVMDLDQNIKNQSNIINKRPFIEWSFCFYIKKLKSSKLITRYKPSIYLRLFYINQINQIKSQKKSKIFNLTY